LDLTITLQGARYNLFGVRADWFEGDPFGGNFAPFPEAA